MPAPTFATSRAAWGARPPTTPFVRVSWRGRRTLWLHHTVGNRVAPAEPGMPGPRWLRVLTTPAKFPADLVRRVRMQKALAEAARARTVEAECAAMRQIQAFHQKTRGWKDIGYGWVLFESGRLYEGRGFEVQAAHCPGHNDEPSVSLAGDYTSRPPTLLQRRTFKQLQSALGTPEAAGHRDGFPTACPGDAAYEALVA